MIGIHAATGQPRRRASMPGLRLQPLSRPTAPAPRITLEDDDHDGRSTPLSALTSCTPSPPTCPSSAGGAGRSRPSARRFHHHRLGSTAGDAAALDALHISDGDDDEASWICALDYEILSVIAGHMDAPTLLALAATQRRFMQLREDRLVWHRIYSSSYGDANVGCRDELRDHLMMVDLDSLCSIDWCGRYRERVAIYAARKTLAADGPLGGELSDLRRGKYTSWSHGNGVTFNALPACLYAIGVLGLHYPLQSQTTDGEAIAGAGGQGPNLHPHQVAALGFLRSVFDEASWRSSSSKRNTPPPAEFSTDEWLAQLAADLGSTKLDFEARTAWATGLSPSDVFGILWHLGGFAVRGWAFGRPSSVGSDHARSTTPDTPVAVAPSAQQAQAAGMGLGLDFSALAMGSTRSDTASIPAIQQINPRQLMCILHLMKLGAGEATYYQLAGVRKPLPERRFGHMDETDFPDMEEEAALLRAAESVSPFAPPSCPRPSSGGITDSFGRPFEGLWGNDDDEASSGDDEEVQDETVQDHEQSSFGLDPAAGGGGGAPSIEVPMSEPEPQQESPLGGLGLTHLSLDAPQTDDEFLEPPPPPGRGGRAKRLGSDSVAESVRESFHFDHFADDDDADDKLSGADEESEEEQWSLDAPHVPGSRTSREMARGFADMAEKLNGREGL